MFGFALRLLALYVFPPIVLELVVAALCVFATYEVLWSTKLVRKPLGTDARKWPSLGLIVGHFSILPLRLRERDAGTGAGAAVRFVCGLS